MINTFHIQKKQDFSIFKKFQARRTFYRPSSARNSGNIAFLKIRYRSKFVQIWCLDGFWGLLDPRNVFFDQLWPVGIRVQIFDWSHISEYIGTRRSGFFSFVGSQCTKIGQNGLLWAPKKLSQRAMFSSYHNRSKYKNDPKTIFYRSPQKFLGPEKFLWVLTLAISLNLHFYHFVQKSLF